MTVLSRLFCWTTNPISLRFTEPASLHCPVSPRTGRPVTGWGGGGNMNCFYFLCSQQNCSGPDTTGVWPPGEKVRNPHCHLCFCISYKNIGHLSLLNLAWFRFENVHVFCLIQNIIENNFFFYCTASFFFLGYGVKILRLSMHRPSKLKKKNLM